MSGVGQIGENVDAFMVNLRRFAVHQFFRPHDLAAERLAPDGLMPQTDAENRDDAGIHRDHAQRDAGIVRRAGAGRNDDAIRRKLANRVNADGIVAEHAQIRA